ncbi:TauD/TfdA family dioxygenase [Xanthomonas hortorum pv. gardneri]|uniref:TauD/TfdA family dioxygenase n=1 Tax=Xanthomonas hortorum TaxID=56454 RepID=UPI001E473874|nr:TauD/TfdA family dioxygenase [Xanthomonas hortorum]MCC8495797.1 TauD/TfdA family dioxygenase [Xanthomonas hortorum pv. gardneri]MCE4530220.1 TauD/TfdA family dioxygenase [Xanthomonas hortorum pv. vitians]
MEVDLVQAMRQSVEEMCSEIECIDSVFEDPRQVGSKLLGLLAGRTDIIAASGALASQLEVDGVVLLKNIFELGEDLNETPQDWLPVPMTWSIARVQMTIIGLNALLQKSTISYRSENDGALFVNLVGMPGHGYSAEKSQKGLRGHTDAMSFPFPGDEDPNYENIAPSPDVVCLGALRNPDSVPTTIMPLASVIKDLDEATIEELMKHKYLVTCQDSFEKGTIAVFGRRHSLSEAAVIHLPSNAGYWVRFSHSKIVAPEKDLNAKNALEKFKLAASRYSKSIPLKPGDVLIVNNRRALHGRSEVGADTGGSSRWLIRTYGLEEKYAHEHFIEGSSFCLYP